MAKRKTKSRSRTSVIPSTDRQWEIQSAADTLIRANEIKSDVSLMRSVKRELNKRQKAITKAVRGK